jgi:NAD(P)-dependent dehydrogenase (short-subunit alcohol dehydrogenase family)
MLDPAHLLDLSGRVAVMIGATSGLGWGDRPGPGWVGREAALARFQRVDILVNTAGRTMKKPWADVTKPEWGRLFDTNVTATLRACQSFYGPLKASGRGRIINLASLGSYRAFHEAVAYCAAKSAVLSLTRSLGCEWAKDGI